MFHADFTVRNTANKRKLKNLVFAWSIAAIAGFTIGFILFLTAFVLMFAGWFTERQDVFSSKEVWLIILSFISMISGAHCFDKIAETRKREIEE